MIADTIFAPATGAGRAALAVIRISGADAAAALQAMSGAVPEPRRASLRTLRGADGQALDQALVLWFPGPGSFTGEDSAELHLHGGRAVVGGVLSALAAFGLRLAEAGEFTRRAFANGRLDLAQAEAVADLVDAETEAQRRQALDQLGGALSGRHQAWRDVLLEALALLEAAVDFPDEEVPHAVADQARPGLERLASELAAALADADRGRRVREGYRIALIGAPNAGKSSLLNALAGRDAAIVTAIPGTTRDVIETPLVLNGYQVLLADTAGLRSTQDVVEAEGVRRAEAWARAADLRLWVVDASDGETPLRPELLQADDWVILSKVDLPRRVAEVASGAPERAVSVFDPATIEALRAQLSERLTADLTGAEFPAATHLRHVEQLTAALDHVRRALAERAHPELAAEDVRLAARALERITGRVDPEQVLDRVFASFCIGK
jgi:tRNA modification GTPase